MDLAELLTDPSSFAGTVVTLEGELRGQQGSWGLLESEGHRVWVNLEGVRSRVRGPVRIQARVHTDATGYGGRRSRWHRCAPVPGSAPDLGPETGRPPG